MYKWKGSYTVEAVFVMTISVFIILSICYTAMFVHDKAVVLSFSHYQTEYCSQSGQGADLEELEKTVRKSLEDKLFLIRIKNVFASKQILQIKVTVDYTLSLSVPLLKKALTGGRNHAEFILKHSYFKPSDLLWDMTILKEK